MKRTLLTLFAGLLTIPAIAPAQLNLDVDTVSAETFIFEPETEKTPVSGVVTITDSHHTFDTEGDAATDDVVTINGGEDGQILIVRPASDDRTVVIKRTGNVEGAADVTLDDLEDVAVLLYRAVAGKWSIVAAGNAAGGGGGSSTFEGLSDTPADLSTIAGYTLAVNAAGNAVVGQLLHKLDATAAPTSGDDTGDGYSPGSVWVDLTNDKAYVCLDDTSSAAVWTDITQSGGGGGGAPTDAPYLTTAANGTLSAEVVTGSLAGDLTFKGNDAAGRTITLGQQVTNADSISLDVPIANVTIDGGVAVNVSAAQELTNKTLTLPVIRLEQGTNPTNTTEGRIQWDTNDDALVIGTGSGTITIDGSGGGGGAPADAKYVVTEGSGDLSAELIAAGFLTTTPGTILLRRTTGWGALTPGSNGQVLTIDTSLADDVKWATPTIPTQPSHACIRDEKASGTDGGTFTSGAWQTRALNAEHYDPDGIVSISSNQFTLGAGEYLIEVSAPAYTVNEHQARLYNVTGAAVVEYGSSEFVRETSPGDYAAQVTTTSTLSAYVDIAGPTVYRVEHRAGTTGSGNGFGRAGSFGGLEVYTTVNITKVGD